MLTRLKAGCYVYKHDFNRTKRVRKLLMLSEEDGKQGKWMALKWSNAGASDSPGGSSTPRGSTTPRSGEPSSPATPQSPRRSSFSDLLMSPRGSDGSTKVSVFEIAQVCFGPYTENFSRRSVEKRIDASHRCFSLLMRSVNRSLDFAFEDDADTLPWLLGLQQLVCYFSPTPIEASMIWTLPKLHVQTLRLKLQAEAETKECSMLQALVGVTRDAARGVYAMQTVDSVRMEAGAIGAKLDLQDRAATTACQSV